MFFVNTSQRSNSETRTGNDLNLVIWKKTQLSSQYNDRDDANYVSWHNDQCNDQDDAGSDDSPGPTPFTNRLWGCVLVNERPVAKYLGKIMKDAARADPDLCHVSCQVLAEMILIFFN